MIKFVGNPTLNIFSGYFTFWSSSDWITRIFLVMVYYY